MSYARQHSIIASLVDNSDLRREAHVGSRTDTRQKMLAGAVDLLRERGAAAVTVDAVLSRSHAPRGSVYHHFPGGRTEIITESLTLAGDTISTLVEHAATEGVSAALRHVGDFWSATLRDSDFTAGCPIVSVAVGGSPDDQQLVPIAAGIFDRWTEALVAVLDSEGVERARAHRLATLTIASIEGAIVLCRTQRSSQPLNDVLAELDLLLRSVTSTPAVTTGGP